MSLPKLDTPTFELTLPSSGKIVKYRPFLVKEHKVLLSLAEADSNEISRIVSDLVDVCTFNTLNMNKLSYFDIEYIFLQLRARSIGEVVDVIVNCDCGAKIETSFNIDNIKVERAPDHSNKIMLTDEYGVEMEYPRFSDIVSVFTAKNNSKVIDIIIDSIKGIFDKENYWEAKDQTREEVESFVYSLTKSQFDKIENFFVTSPKIVQEIETDCTQCGKHNVSRLEGLSNFFV